jgi:hypothetical protein
LGDQYIDVFEQLRHDLGVRLLELFVTQPAVIL